MTDIEPRDGGQLTGRSIAILMESDYVEPELHYYLRRFAEEGARTVLLTRLWGQGSLTFHGHEYQIPITVDGDLEAIDDERLREFDALIVPAGMVSDRLRFTEDPDELAPAVELLRRAFAMPELLKGIICHGMWLVAPIPEVVRGRRITCHNNLVSDVRNMGAVYTDQDIVVDGDLVTGRSAHECHQCARMIIDLIAARNARHRPAVHTSGASESAQVNKLDFTFSDLIAGYVTSYHPGQRLIDMATGDGRSFQVTLTDTTYAEFTRNLGEPFASATERLEELLVPGRHLFAHGVFYPEGGQTAFEAQRLVLSGRGPGGFSFEQPDWWVRQVREIGQFYRRAQFGSAKRPDYGVYRTMVLLSGQKADSGRQETDTISRLVYGMATAYMLTGDEDFLEVADSGTEYLRDHMRFVDRDEDVTYWYHGIDVRDGAERKVYASEFGDDYDAIPAYEQIYALAGPTQLYRITGDERIATDIDGTMRLFRKFFRDPEQGGYFSHIDPVWLSPHDESLGANRSRKNWNSVGDHAPAYLFNLYLATGEERHAEMLEDTFDTIVAHFPREDSPFVQERFHADWSPDREWGWQQNRAVVGHNLKIAWNLMRMMAIRPKADYSELAKRLGRIMPAVGSDAQRGGWYDMEERVRATSQRAHRFTWHDHKTWWQQEQAILAYLILAGHTGDDEFIREARQAAAFYNGFFLDHDEGGVFFSVLADGTPYLSGTERYKGSHSMSMYHSAELCYLATVYQRLLINREPLALWFRPRPDGFRDRVLRTAPDALPPGSVRLEWVEVDGKPYSAFDANEMTVKLPDSQSAVTVCAHLVPTNR
jgi:mannose/cellobiose epimerase-like protein (N-acyl-D-glucosamine 2-epimerase family)/putative intracellular protease/amidase